MADFKFEKIGKGQVEPNHLSAQRNGQIYAQLPMGVDELENGQFAKYNYADGVVDLSADKGGEWMLVYNEVQLYGRNYNETEADYSMKKVDFTDKIATPRLFKTAVGDIFTTNAIKIAESEAVNLKDKLVVGTDGFLKLGTTGDMIWQVVKCYTMPDGKPGVKIQRIK